MDRAHGILDDAGFGGWDDGAWVGLGAASMIPVIARRLDEGRVADAALVGEGLAIFESTHRRRKAARA